MEKAFAAFSIDVAARCRRLETLLPNSQRCSSLSWAKVLWSALSLLEGLLLRVLKSVVKFCSHPNLQIDCPDDLVAYDHIWSGRVGLL